MPVEQTGSAEKLRRFSFTNRDFKSFSSLRQAVERFAPAALRKFCDHLRTASVAYAPLTSPAEMEEARERQLRRWRVLFERKPDEAFAAAASRAGGTGAATAVPPAFLVAACAHLLDDMLPRISRWSPLRPFARNRQVAATLVKTILFDLDVALAEHFEAELAARRDATAKLSHAMDRIAFGDFTTPLDYLPEDYAELARKFEVMRSRVSATFRKVSEAAERISTSSAAIDGASADLSQRTDRQVTTLEHTSTAMDEITATVKDTAAASGRASSAVGQVRADIEASGALVGQAVDAMRRIEVASGEISEIIAVIDGIAFQTNLLALNAGVEAARAGPAGSGFAVVASEVRALAQRSADAARDVKDRITGSSGHVSDGVRLVSDTGVALTQIVSRIGEVSDLVSGIAAAAQAQAARLHQVNMAVSEMDHVTQQNAAMVEEATAAARQLAEDAANLTRRMGSLRLMQASTHKANAVRRAAA